MNKTRLLRKKNNDYEKSLPAETQKLLTDIVVYLKSFPISEYQVEQVRLDITRMLLEGARRGASPSEVLGEDYRALCHQIIDELPARTFLQSLAYHADILSLGISILMPLWLITGLTKNIKEGLPLTFVEVSSGTITATLLILVISYSIVQYICRTSLDTDSRKEHRKKQILFCCILFLSVFVCTLPALLLRNTALRLNTGIYILGFILFFMLHKILDAYTD